MALDEVLKLLILPASMVAVILLLLSLSWLWDRFDRLFRRWQESWGKNGRDNDRY